MIGDPNWKVPDLKHISTAEMQLLEMAKFNARLDGESVGAVGVNLLMRPAYLDARSPEAAAYRRWYWTARWRRISKAHLEAEPLCARCQRAGRLTPATVCHHAVPHKGDPVKFWSGPFLSSCAPCHDSEEQRDEKRGYMVGVDAAGRPVDPNHPWNRKG